MKTIHDYSTKFFTGYVCLLLLLLLTACSAPQPEVQLRLANLTNNRLFDLSVQFPAGEVAVGDMAPHSNSDYQLQKGVYAETSLAFSASDQPYRFEATVSDEAEPLAEGNYTIAIQLVNDEVQQAVLNDDAPHFDETLVGYWLWKETQLASGETTIPANNYVEPSGILFTKSPSVNVALEGQLFGAYTGCNSAGGSFFTTPQQQLIMHLVTFAGEICAEEIVSAENLILQAINGITTYIVADNTLTIILTNGDKLIFNK